jgi:hypothetical protein
MRTSPLRTLFLLAPMGGLLAQTPSLQMNVVYVCTDGQSFKVFSCNDATGACDYQNYKNGQAFQRGEALKVQLAALLPAKCHAQTPAEAQTDPHRGEIPQASSPFAGRAGAPRGGNSASTSQTPAAASAQNTATGAAGGGGFKAGDSVRVLASGWQDAKILQVRGNSYFVRLDNGIEVSKDWPIEVRRQGKLTAADHAAGQWDLHERVQVLVNGRWMEGEIVGQSYNRYKVQLPGERTVAIDGDRTVEASAENLRASTAPPPPPARPAGQSPQAGLASCAGRYEGRWEHVSGLGGMTVVFRSGKVTVSGGLGGPEEFECWVSGGHISLYKAGSPTPFSYGFEVNNDGTLQTPLGAIKKMGN